MMTPSYPNCPKLTEINSETVNGYYECNIRNHLRDEVSRGDCLSATRERLAEGDCRLPPQQLGAHSLVQRCLGFRAQLHQESVRLLDTAPLLLQTIHGMRRFQSDYFNRALVAKAGLAAGWRQF
jgi:hypothetical protein